MKKTIFFIIFSLSLSACTASNPPAPSQGHIKSAEKENSAIPKNIVTPPILPRPQARKKIETYTVVVNQVPVQELLFSMARDAHLNLDIDNNIDGKITMNAIDQTLPAILERIESQSNIRYKLVANVLQVRADTPYLHIYNVDYLNIERSSQGKVSVSTEIATAGKLVKGVKNTASSNQAKTEVKNKSSHKFWQTITENIRGILNQEKTLSKNKSTKDNRIIVNKESGVIAIHARAKQHKKIKRFIDHVVNNAQRQVLIEATIAEVRLSDKYQAGIDWSLVSKSATVGGQSVITKGGVQSLLGATLGSVPFLQLATTGSINGNPLNITLKALETFGDVKVLSSPKVMALNNQTAILKVVDNEIYFSTDVTVTAGNQNQNSLVTVDTDINTVPIGFVMSVTPYIDEKEMVTLNVRPTISRIIKFVNDPSPSLATAGIISPVPVVQVREIETMLKIKDRETAVIGGLMQDQINKDNRGVPFFSSLPIIGNLFSYNAEEYVKSELVIFIRPVIIESASLDGDLADYKKFLLEDLQQKTQKRLNNDTSKNNPPPAQ